MSGVVLGSNNITINGRIMESGKSNGIKITLDTISKTQVETLTGVNGWRLVRFLPPTSSVWYSGNDNLEGTRQLNHATRLMTQEWTVLFGTFNEYCFSTLNFAHWLYCTKDAVTGAFYDNSLRPILKSSTSNVPYSSRWYNRQGNTGEDPWLSVGNYPNNVIYGENTNGVNLGIIPQNEGMCVWVRSSTDTIAMIQPITSADFKHLSLPNTGANQTRYNITFNENTEVQLLLLDGTKYIESGQLNISPGSFELIVGKSGSFSSFLGFTTGTNGITYGSGSVSNITGTNITYNNPIVIVRYASSLAQWTYSASNPNVFHLGNVGIGTTNPTSALHVLGSVQVNGDINATSLTANTKNFKIEHPLNINKWLYHGCVESPRFDNIYRGKKKIINGRGEVDIDEECNKTGGMTKGTFVELNTNCQVYLENKQSYDGVKGSINGSKLIINCENIEEEIEVDWLVIGERKDENIKSNELTNNEGKLICEHDME
jgi:hypothetical protein